MQAQVDPFIAPPCHAEIEIIHAEAHFLVINKPSGLLSLSGKHPANKDSVHFRLVQDYPNALMIHRLDFGTSGLMVIALNKEANANLCKQFQLRTVNKHYQALLYGHLTDNCGEITLPIAKGDFPLQVICHSTGKSAHSNFNVIERLQQPKATRVEFKPITGRTHQLRVHSQAIGHSILGCDLYDVHNSYALAKRLMLHANYLAFNHPTTNKALTFYSSAPF